MKSKVIFIIGGARSGKSSFALNEASKVKGGKAYIATAGALDEEMKKRIEKHKRERGIEWNTYEEPLNISDLIKKIDGSYHVIILDCLTLWLSNLMHKSTQPENNINEFINILASLSRSNSKRRNNGC